MLSQTTEPGRSKLLLVEGNDDVRLFSAMSLHLGIDITQVDKYNGKPNLGNDLSERVRNPDFHRFFSLGIVRDADDSSRSAFDSVVGSLRRAKLPTPDGPMTPIERDGKRISVLILPPDEIQGELEDVCLHSVAGSLDMRCLERYFDCLSRSGPPIADNHLAKAKIHAYLASGPVPLFYTGEPNESSERRRPGLRLGEAAEARVWNWSSPAFALIVDFLRKL